MGGRRLFLGRSRTCPEASSVQPGDARPAHWVKAVMSIVSSAGSGGMGTAFAAGLGRARPVCVAQRGVRRQPAARPALHRPSCPCTTRPSGKRSRSVRSCCPARGGEASAPGASAGPDSGTPASGPAASGVPGSSVASGTSSASPPRIHSRVDRRAARRGEAAEAAARPDATSPRTPAPLRRSCATDPTSSCCAGRSRPASSHL